MALCTFVDELKFENLDSVCRSCLSADAQFNIFLCMYDEENLATILQRLFFDTTENLDNEKMPQNMCEKCTSELISVCEFRQQYRRSQLLLQNMILCNSEEPVSEDDFEVFTIIRNENDVPESEDDNPTEDVNNLVINEESVKSEHESVKIIPNDLIKDENVEDETLNDVNINIIHKPIKPKCSSCEISFETREEYLNHQKKVKHKVFHRRYLCEYCGIFFSTHSLHHHRRVHTVDKNFECDQCSYRSREKSNLDRHMKKHTGEKPYICEFCAKGYIQKYDLTLHINSIHTGEKPYMCEICGKTFVDLRQQKKHKLMHINKLESTDDDYSQSSSSPSKRQHSTTEKPFQCNVCLKYFSQSSSLLLHSRIHKGIKPHVCNICYMRFTQKQHLQSHIRIHTGEKPYKCKYCSKDFNHLTNFNVHVRLHTGERPYKCEHCDKAFPGINGLKRHRITHSKNRISKTKIIAEKNHKN